jgi:hypothetical protein
MGKTSVAFTRTTIFPCDAVWTELVGPAIGLEVIDEDLRPEPIDDRKRRLAGLLRLPHEGIALNEHFGGAGAVICKHACALGCEGIVSKRSDHRIAPVDRLIG